MSKAWIIPRGYSCLFSSQSSFVGAWSVKSTRCVIGRGDHDRKLWNRSQATAFRTSWRLMGFKHEIMCCDGREGKNHLIRAKKLSRNDIRILLQQQQHINVFYYQILRAGQRFDKGHSRFLRGRMPLYDTVGCTCSDIFAGVYVSTVGGRTRRHRHTFGYLHLRDTLLGYTSSSEFSPLRQCSADSDVYTSRVLFPPLASQK